METFSCATPSQRAVAELLCADPAPSVPEIAQSLGMAIATVRTHIRVLAGKLPNPDGLPAARLIRASAGCSPAPPRRRERPVQSRSRQGVSPQLRARVMERDGFRCRRCGHSPPDVKLAVDHIWPVALGGETVEANLQTLCEDCNLGKGERPPHTHDLRPVESVSLKQNSRLS